MSTGPTFSTERDTNVGSLSDWEAGFGTPAGSSAAVGVPEPSGAAMMLLATISLFAVYGKRRCPDLCINNKLMVSY